MADVVQQYYEKLMDLMFSSQGKIQVANDFHGKMNQINQILKNDRTGLISSILEFMVHSATVDFDIETGNSNLNKILLDWKKNLNDEVNIDIPKGLRSFTEQYFRERWKSSFIVLRIRWKKKKGYWLPHRMWFMDGSSIYVKNESGSLNTNEYYFGKPNDKKTNRLENNETETIIVRKPYNYWYDQYPTPYLARKGALYHALFKIKTLERQAEIINTAFPYQFFIKAGCEEAMRRSVMPNDEDLKALLNKFKKRKEEIDEHAFARGLGGAFPFDVKFEEIIPDYKKALDEAILKGTDKNLLFALGMIEFRGFSSNREEAILNPKVLIEEVQDAVLDYTSLLSNIMGLIKKKNQGKYRFNTDIEVSPGIIKSFVTDDLRELVRSWYDRGIISKESAVHSTTPLNFNIEVKKRDNERRDRLNFRMYPPVTQNMEKDSDTPSLPEKNENINEDRKPNTPEAENFKAIYNEPIKNIRSLPDVIRGELSKDQQRIFKDAFNDAFEKCSDLNIKGYDREKTSMIYASEKIAEYFEAPYKNNSELPKSIKSLPSAGQTIWRKAFNQAVKDGHDEKTSFKIAWSVVKKVYKKNKDGDWVKKKNR